VFCPATACRISLNLPAADSPLDHPFHDMLCWPLFAHSVTQSRPTQSCHPHGLLLSSLAQRMFRSRSFLAARSLSASSLLIFRRHRKPIKIYYPRLLPFISCNRGRAKPGHQNGRIPIELGTTQERGIVLSGAHFIPRESWHSGRNIEIGARSTSPRCLAPRWTTEADPVNHRCVIPLVWPRSPAPQTLS
jgi:hypothetical protein